MPTLVEDPGKITVPKTLSEKLLFGLLALIILFFLYTALSATIKLV